MDFNTLNFGLIRPTIEKQIRTSNVEDNFKNATLFERAIAKVFGGEVVKEKGYDVIVRESNTKIECIGSFSMAQRDISIKQERFRLVLKNYRGDSSIEKATYFKNNLPADWYVYYSLFHNTIAIMSASTVRDHIEPFSKGNTCVKVTVCLDDCDFVIRNIKDDESVKVDIYKIEFVQEILAKLQMGDTVTDAEKTVLTWL